MGLKNTRTEQTYVSILADGQFHVTVPEGTEGSVVREYETSDGKKGVKTEMVYTELSGIITNVAFKDGDFGKSLQLTVQDEENVPMVLSVSTASNFGEDIMKKIPNLDLKQAVKLAPYSFDDEKGKKKKGVTIYQPADTKIKNFFYDEEKKEVCNGYPETKFKKKVPTKDDWKLYFMNARMFLIDYITEKFATPVDKGSSDEEFEKLIEDAKNVI